MKLITACQLIAAIFFVGVPKFFWSMEKTIENPFINFPIELKLYSSQFFLTNDFKTSFKHLATFASLNKQIHEELTSPDSLTFFVESYKNLFGVVSIADALHKSLPKTNLISLLAKAGFDFDSLEIKDEYPSSLMQVSFRGDYDEFTPLLYACLKGYGEAVKHFIQAGSDITKITKLMRRTALHCALASKNAELISFVVGLDVDPTVGDRNNETSFYFATRINQFDALISLLDHNFFNQLSCEELDALFKWPAAYGNIAVMEILLEKRKKFEHEKKLNLDELLSLAASRGHLDGVKFLFSEGAPLTSCNSNGYGSLYSAMMAKERGADIVHYLLQQGIDVNQTSLSGTTPLMHAARLSNYEAVKFLLEYNAEVNARDAQGETALLAAVKELNFEICDLLIKNKAGAEIDMLYRPGRTVLMLAVSCGNENIIKLLLDAGADCNVVGYKGHTALITACHINKIKAVELLLERKPDVEVKQYRGRTALSMAVCYGNNEIVHMLLKHGVIVDTENESGRTPLHTAVRLENLEIIQSLLTYGADMFKADFDGITPYERACQNKNAEIIELFDRFLISENCKNV